MEKPVYPMRINKYLAWKKYSTRKGGDELVAKKHVFINGRQAVLGDKVGEGDTVEVRQYRRPETYRYFAYNKPQGVITHSPGRGETDIKEASALRGVFPVGRLDKSSRGLIILTNDGRITDRLLNPDYAHDKEYVVTTAERLRPSFKEHMEKGIVIEGYKTKPCRIEILGDRTFSITLTEGKKHQIRRMCVALHADVVDLERVRIGNIELADLRTGEYRPITGKELEVFLKNLGL